MKALLESGNRVMNSISPRPKKKEKKEKKKSGFSEASPKGGGVT